MTRLQSRAEEAAAAGDAEGASMSMGKAALMAAELAKDRPDRIGQHFRGAEALFRAQEHAYRALGLFQRAGGHPPASTGVCQTIHLAGQFAGDAEQRLGAVLKVPPQNKVLPETPYLQQARRLQADAADWIRIIEGMTADFQCTKEGS